MLCPSFTFCATGAGQVKRGDSSAFARDESGKFVGGAAIVLTIQKQPNADTRQVTRLCSRREEMQPSLPRDVASFPISTSRRTSSTWRCDNVVDALRDGGILVVIMLFCS